MDLFYSTEKENSCFVQMETSCIKFSVSIRTLAVHNKYPAGQRRKKKISVLCPNLPPRISRAKWKPLVHPRLSLSSLPSELTSESALLLFSPSPPRVVLSLSLSLSVSSLISRLSNWSLIYFFSIYFQIKKMIRIFTRSQKPQTSCLYSIANSPSPPSPRYSSIACIN